MKTKLIFLISLALFSCSTNKCLKIYLKEEMKNNKDNSISILRDKKSNSLQVIKVYGGIKRGKTIIKAKSFNQEDYDFIYNRVKGDTLASFWDKKKGASYIVKKRAEKRGDSIFSEKEEKDFHTINNKPIFEFWTKSECKNFKINHLEESFKNEKYYDSIEKISEDKIIYRYNISKPLYTKNNKKVLFSISKREKGFGENYVIIMEKQNGNWSVLERIENPKNY